MIPIQRHGRWTSKLLSVFVPAPMRNRRVCLRARPYGYYLTNKRRRMTLAEMSRLQGFPPLKSAVVSRIQLGQMLGNTMTVDVVKEVLREGLRSTGLLPGGASDTVHALPSPSIREFRPCEFCETPCQGCADQGSPTAFSEDTLLGACRRCDFHACDSCRTSSQRCVCSRLVESVSNLRIKIRA